MKRLFLLLILSLVWVDSFGQATFDALILNPKTESQRLAIVSPRVGMSVYQSDGNKGIYTYNSSGWFYTSKGDQGIQGVQGIKGDQGIQGLKGDILKSICNLMSDITP